MKPVLNLYQRSADVSCWAYGALPIPPSAAVLLPLLFYDPVTVNLFFLNIRALIHLQAFVYATPMI